MVGWGRIFIQVFLCTGEVVLHKITFIRTLPGIPKAHSLLGQWVYLPSKILKIFFIFHRLRETDAIGM